MKIRNLLFLFAILFATNSKAQYKYLGTFTSTGLPNYLVTSDVISAASLAQIRNALPEGFPVPVYNPHYITSGYDSDVKLIDSAEVFVTFVDEGAGYKNVLGFYTYNLSNPLTTVPASSQISIIFPNVSKLGSGGSLLSGHKVSLGKFPANTGIGFVLIANGFSNGVVGNGLWKLYSNPNFNPEATASLRNHNVLISDSVNKRLYLGFEDIRRDNAGCDNDFNDAIFYVTASSYRALEVANVVIIETANAAISSGNDGGLESNGKLAEKIAIRNFERLKNPTLKKSNLQQQQLITAVTNAQPRPNTRLPMASYLPNTGMYGTELPYNSTANDLLNITNAQEVFSADYYSDSQRVAVGLATYTATKVYDHSKMICDRLNAGSIEDVRTVLLKNHKLIMVIFKKSDLTVEYAICFSVKILPNQFNLHSYWTIDQYPAGEYLNFQVWGKNMGQVCNIINNIFNKLEEQAPLTSDPALTKIPAVFVKKGNYKNGRFYLTVANKLKLTTAQIIANYSTTEKGSMQQFLTNIDLGGSILKEVELNQGSIFDAGISLNYLGVEQIDALYLADGAWGVNYEAEQAKNIAFQVSKNESTLDQQILNIERSPSVNGLLKNNFYLFRNAKSGNTALDISSYSNISFEVQSNKPVEVVLLSNTHENWNNRARFTIAARNEWGSVTIPLSKFTDSAGNPVNITKIKSIAFAVQGNNQQFVDFNLSLKKVNFNNNPFNPLSLENYKLKIYPNPINKVAQFILPAGFNSGNLIITDVAGKLVRTEKIASVNGEYIFSRKEMLQGLYFYKLISADNFTYSGSFKLD